MADVVATGELRLSTTIDTSSLDAALSRVQQQAAKAGTAAGDSFSKGFNSTTSAINKIDSTVSKGLDSTIKAVTTSVKGLAAIGGAGLVALGTKAITAGVAFNELQAKVRGALGVILGSTDAANKLIVSVNELADQISFIPRDVFLSATQNLVGFGVAADKVVPIMNAVQNTVAGIGGSAADFSTIVDQFARIQAAGKITGDILLSFSTRGINAADLIAKELNKVPVAMRPIGQEAEQTGETIKKAISDGAFDAEKSITLLTNALNSKFGGAATGLTKSLTVARQSIKSRLRDIGADITASLVNPLGTVFDPSKVKAFTHVFDATGKALKGVNLDQKTIDGFKTLSENGGALVAILDKVVQGLRAIRALVAQNADLQVFLIKASVAAGNLADKILKIVNGFDSSAIGSFVQTLGKLAPTLVLIGTQFFNTFARQIPFVGKLLGSFNPFIAALVVLAVKSKDFRDQAAELFKVLGAIATKVGPPLAEAFKKLQDAVGVLATGALKSLTDTIRGLAPAFVIVANAVNLFASALKPLASLLNNPIFTTFLELFIAKAAIAKVTGTDAFKSIGSAVTTAIGAIKGFTSPAAAAADETKNLAEHAATAKDAFKDATGGLLTLDQAVAGGTKHFSTLKDAMKGASKSGTDLGTSLKTANKALADTGTKLVQNRTATGQFASGFSQVSTSAASAAGGLEKAAAGAGKLASAGAAAKGGLAALAGSIDPVTLGIQIATVGIGIMINRIEKLKQKANEKAANLADSLGLKDLTAAQLNGPDGAITGISKLQSDIDAAKKKLNSGAQVKIGGFRIAPFKDVNKDAAAVSALEKQLKAVQTQSANVKKVFGDIGKAVNLPRANGALSPATFDEISAKAKELGIDITKLTPGPETAQAIKTIEAAFAQLSTTIGGKVVPSLQSIQDNFDALEKKAQDLFSADAGLKSANASLASAQDQLSSATDNLNKLQLERQDVLRKTITPVQEMKKAEDDLAKSRRSLEKISREQADTEADLAKLRGPQLAIDQAAGDRSVERAKIALAKAQRDEQAAQDALNTTTQAGIDLKNKDQAVEITGVNLAGLTLDQARAKLANVRASLAAQQQAAAATKTAVADTNKPAKTAVELAEDAKLAQLDTADAAKAVNDAIAARGQIDADNAKAIQDDELKLADLNQQKTDELANQQTINQKIADIRRGDTEQGRALKAIDDQITAGKKQQAAAQTAVSAALDATKLAQLELNKASALFRNDQAAALDFQRQIFDLKSKGLNVDAQTSAEIKKQFDVITGQLDQFKQAKAIADQTAASLQKARDLQTAGLQANNAGDSANFVLLAQSIQNLADALGPEAAVRQAAIIAKITGHAVPTVNAEGSLVTKPIISHIGEGFKPELILPMTKPDRVWELVSKHLPKFPGAMAAVQSAISPQTISYSNSSPLNTNSYSSVAAVKALTRGTNVVGHKGDLPMTRDQADEIIRLLSENGGGTVTVEAPITVQGAYNEDILAMRLEKRLLKSIENKMR